MLTCTHASKRKKVLLVKDLLQLSVLMYIEIRAKSCLQTLACTLFVEERVDHRKGTAGLAVIMHR